MGGAARLQPFFFLCKRGVWAGRRSEGRAVVRGIHCSYFVVATYSADGALRAHFNRLVRTPLHRHDCVCWLFDFEKKEDGEHRTMRSCS